MLNQPAAYKDLKLSHTQQRLISKEQQSVYLTSTEYHLMQALISSPEHKLTKLELCNIIWQETITRKQRALYTHICKLRKKLQTLPTKSRIKTTRTGYQLD